MSQWRQLESLEMLQVAHATKSAYVTTQPFRNTLGQGWLQCPSRLTSSQAHLSIKLPFQDGCQHASPLHTEKERRQLQQWEEDPRLPSGYPKTNRCD